MNFEKVHFYIWISSFYKKKSKDGKRTFQSLKTKNETHV